MGQISFKIPDEEIIFLKWYTKKTAESMSSVYRSITFQGFITWKIEYLLAEYSKGVIGFKQLCKLGNLTFTEAMLLIEKYDIEPPISEVVDLATSRATQKIIRKLRSN